MPAVDVAMERSIRAGFRQLLVASLRPVFERRDVITDAQGQIGDVKTAFSSWDNCMNAVYCKWPVIGIIIIGGLILISVAWCIIRCCCCGLSCCCECFQCLKCCGNCCGCCDPPKGKHKYLDESYIPPHHAAGYKSHDPMVSGPAAPFPSRPVAAFEPPQYADFDVSKKGGAQVHEDALPAMPSWEGAGQKKVLVEGEEVEMDQLKRPDATAAAGSATSMQNVPLMTGASAVPGPVSPIPSPNHRSPYSPPGSTAVAGGYMAAGGANADPYATNARGYNNGYNNGANPYGQSATSLGTDQGYGMAAGAVTGGGRSPQDYINAAGYRQGTPGQDGYTNQNVYGQDQGYPAAGPAAAGYLNYGQARQDSYDNYSQPGNQGYGRGQARGPPARQNTGGYPQELPVRQNTGGYPQERMTRSPAPMTPAPMASEYGRGGANFNQGRTYSPAPVAVPQDQEAYEMPAEPAGPLNNDVSFDFGAGYTRPARTITPANDYGRSTPAHDDGYGGQQQQPARQQPGAYPGHRAWQQPSQQQQPQQGWGGQ